MRSKIALLAALSLMAMSVAAGVAVAAAPPAPFFNGFESPGDVDAGDNMAGVTRVPSGTNGVNSATGAWHAQAPAGSFTRYGGYSGVFPTHGYTTSVDIYLDTANSPLGSDIRADWSSAISGTAVFPTVHRRDFIFSFGTNGAGGFVMSASNNSPGWPANPARDPYTITTTGWYTFQHTFYDAGSGVLAVDMSVLDSSGTVLTTWTLSDPSDIIGSTVGGNRDWWLVTNGFADLAIDNVYRSGVLPMPEVKDDCKNGGWINLFRADDSSFKNEGDCIQYVNTGK